MLFALLGVLALQAPSADRVLLSDRSEVRGELVGASPRGTLRVRLESGREREFGWEEIVRIIPAGLPAAVAGSRAADRARLAQGTLLVGRVERLDAADLEMSTACGRIRAPASEVRGIHLGTPTLPFADLRSGTDDAVFFEAPPEGRGGLSEPAVLYGRVLGVGEAVELETADQERRSLPRSQVKRILFRSRGNDVPALPGWFLRVSLKDGSQWSGVLASIDGERLRVFSPMLGTVEVPKAAVRVLTFSTKAGSGEGRILVGENGRVREFDRSGREVWSYAVEGMEVRMARRLDNGNVLLVCPGEGRVIEVRPQGATGGVEVRALSELVYPFDALQLPGGNLLVAECHGNRVGEFDAAGTRVRTRAIRGPLGLQLLSSGNLLVTTNEKLIEMDPEGGEVQSPRIAGGLRPYRAERLDGGNLLVTDYSRGSVLELDGEGQTVWRHEGLRRPVQALRLDDGNTLILEQGTGTLIEVDAVQRGRSSVVLKGLTGAGGFTVN